MGTSCINENMRTHCIQCISETLQSHPDYEDIKHYTQYISETLKTHPDYEDMKHYTQYISETLQSHPDSLLPSLCKKWVKSWSRFL